MALMIEETECEALSFPSQIGCAFPKVLSSFVFGLPKAVSLYFSTVPSVIAVKQTVVDRQTPWSKLPPSVFLQIIQRWQFQSAFVCLLGFFFFGGGFFFLSLMYFAVQRAALGCQSENQSQKSCVTDAGILLGRLVFQASLGIQAISRRARGCCPLIKCSWQCLSRLEDRADTTNALTCASAEGCVWGQIVRHVMFEFSNFSNFRVSLRHVGSDCQGVVLKFLYLCIFLTLSVWQYVFIFSVPCDSGNLSSLSMLIAGSI